MGNTEQTSVNYCTSYHPSFWELTPKPFQATSPKIGPEELAKLKRFEKSIHRPRQLAEEVKGRIATH